MILQAGRKAYDARQYGAAIAEFDRARAMCPKAPLLPLAKAQLMAQRLQDSLHTTEELLRVETGNVEAVKLRGDILYLLGREPEAEQAMKAALEIQPEYGPAQYALGRIYYQQNRFPEALELFRSAVESDPHDYRSHDNLALCYAALRQDSSALQHFLKALDLVHKDHPGYDTVYANAANFFLERQQYRKAFQLAVEAAKRNPVSARNFFLAGKSLVCLDKHDLSIRWFSEASKLDPNYTEPHYWLVTVYRKLGRTEDAARELEKFRELSKAPKLRR